MRIPAIRIEQPLGVFFAVSLSAEFLLKVCYTIRTEFVDDEDYNHHTPKNMMEKLFSLSPGSQRNKDEKRVDQITRYTETVSASFPNSIILGANYDEEGNLIENESKRWTVEEDNGLYYLVIPTEEKLASIIDGQHRLFAFKNSTKKDMPLLCSVYLDLPLPYHAQIFATINMNQKKVDKNHIYQLFQFELEQGDSETWSPETLSVYFARVLAEKENSPLYNKLKLGISEDNNTSISMASVVDGIISLITTKPKDDREKLYSKAIEDGRSRELLTERTDSSPLRELYLSNKDRTLYDIIYNYFDAVESTINKNNKDNVFHRTLGIHALFDVLKEITKTNGAGFKYSKEYFEGLFNYFTNFDFKIEFYGIQTKLRSRLKNTLLLGSGFKGEDDLKTKFNQEDIEEIKKLIKTPA